MNHVTHKTALALKSAGFHQHDTKIGQYWYDDNGIATVALGQYNGGIALRSLEAADVDWQWVLHCQYYTFAPTATDIMKELGGEFMLCFLNDMWHVKEVVQESNASNKGAWARSPGLTLWPESSHANPAEAAAMAWMALNKKI